MQAVREPREEEFEDRVSDFLEEKRQFGPGGVRWPALVAAVVLVGAAFAPAGAIACVVVAFLANHPVQRRWRGACIILAAFFVVASFAGIYLLKPGGNEGGGGIDGEGDATGQVLARPA